MPPNHFIEHPTGLHRLKTAVAVDSGPDAAMAEEPTNGLIIAGMILQVNRGRRMAILMGCHPQSGDLVDSVRDLDAE
jgi:hypothetical protein